MTKCYGHEECEYNGQPECHLPDGMKCPHGVKADKPTNADHIRSVSDEELAKVLYRMQKDLCRRLTEAIGYTEPLEFDEDAPDILNWLQQPAEEEEDNNDGMP